MKRARKEESKATTKFDLEQGKQEVKLRTLGDGKSWVLSTVMAKVDRPTKEEIDTLWSMRPAEKSIIKMYNKNTPVPRYNQTYSNDGKGYHFSGIMHEAKPIPPLVARYLAYANRICATILQNDYEGREFNMAFINWYPDGFHYIGPHSDSESQLLKNNRQESIVFSISFGQERVFRITPKDKESKEEKTDMVMKDCCVLLMGGLCQTNYKHEVPKVTSKRNPLGPRLNLTFRIFK